MTAIGALWVELYESSTREDSVSIQYWVITVMASNATTCLLSISGGQRGLVLVFHQSIERFGASWDGGDNPPWTQKLGPRRIGCHV